MYSIIAKFHYTGPTGPARTRTDPTEFLGDPGRKKVGAGPVGSGRARVVAFSYYIAGVSIDWRLRFDSDARNVARTTTSAPAHPSVRPSSRAPHADG